MNKYIIYCTLKQTKKALELGAPITTKFHKVKDIYDNYFYEIEEKNGEPVLEIPTAEQMIGWLENQEMSFQVFENAVNWSYDIVIKNNVEMIREDGFTSRKESTIAAIDAALEYLSNNNN